MVAPEIGCGTGSTPRAHVPHLHRVATTDVPGRMVEAAHRWIPVPGSLLLAARRRQAA